MSNQEQSRRSEAQRMIGECYTSIANVSNTINSLGNCCHPNYLKSLKDNLAHYQRHLEFLETKERRIEEVTKYLDGADKDCAVTMAIELGLQAMKVEHFDADMAKFYAEHPQLDTQRG